VIGVLLNEIEAIHNNAVNKGFWDTTVDANFILAKLCLIHSEISEIMEAYRKQHGPAAIEEEFADVFIRLYDLLVGLAESGVVTTYDIDEIIRKKMVHNMTRPAKHGNLI
jgi:NTP pyrophosphatase (non-canonical NTP hydrolase)